MKSTDKWSLICVLCFLAGAGSFAWGITPTERAELAYQKGQSLELACDFQKAAEYYKEAVEQDKKNAHYQYKLAYVYTQLKPPEVLATSATVMATSATKDAINQLKSLLKLDPEHKAAYSLLGRLYFQQGENKKAETAFESALKIDSQFAEPHFFLGEMWRQRAAEAPNLSQQAIIHYQTYLKLATQGEYTDIAQERLRELLYGDSGVQLNLAIFAMRNFEYDRALTFFNRLLQSDATTIEKARLNYLNQEVHYWRGLLYSIPEAPVYDPTGIKSEREWLDAPDVITARIDLGNWYYQMEEIQSAIGHFEAAIRLGSTSPACPCGGWLVQRAYFYLGKAYMENNQPQKALEAFQKMQAIDPDGEFVSEAQAFIQLLSGKAPEQTQPSDAPILSLEQWSEFLRWYGNVVQDAAIRQRLESILTRILTAMQPLSSYPYSIVILENPAVNAWSLPGGQIVVCTGLLQFVRTYLHDSDDVLAFFIGHEVAHLVNRDMERSQEGIQVIKAAFAGGNPPLMTFQHGLSRAAELRADTDGVLFAYRAKFNPATAIQWCEAMIATYGDTDPNGDHPTFKARKERLKWFLTGEIQVAYGKFRVGVDAFHKGDYAVAAENFSGYLNRFPYDKYAINNLGVVYHQQAIRKAGGAPHGEWRLAMGVEVKPDLPPLHIRGNPPEGTLDEVLLRKAIQQFETALRIDRRYKVAYKNLGDVYGDLGEFDRANEAYKQALNIDSQYAEAQNSLGVLLCRQKQFEDGIHLFQEVLRLAKDNLEARYNLALAYEYASQPEKARDAWQAYLIFDGKSDWADRARGHLGE